LAGDKMAKQFDLTIEKRKRSWCICAGVSILAKHRTEEAAKKDLEKGKGFYEYWAGSVSVNVENTPPRIVDLTDKI